MCVGLAVCVGLEVCVGLGIWVGRRVWVGSVLVIVEDGLGGSWLAVGDGLELGVVDAVGTGADDSTGDSGSFESELSEVSRESSSTGTSGRLCSP